MAGSFLRRSQELIDAVGDGDLEMGGIVGQPYAAAIHNKEGYRHPRGGMARYLEVPYLAQREEMIMHLAINAVTPSGSNLLTAAIEVASKFDDMVRQNAPVEFDVLRDSTNYYVVDNGQTVFFSGQRDPRNLEKQ